MKILTLVELEIKVGFPQASDAENPSSPTNDKTYVEFRASSRLEQDDWVQLLQKAIIYAKLKPTASPQAPIEVDNILSASPSEREGVDGRLKDFYSPTGGRNRMSSFISANPTRLPSSQSSWRKTMTVQQKTGDSLTLSQKAKNRLSRAFHVTSREDGEFSPSASVSGNGELSLVEQYYREQEQLEKDKEEDRKRFSQQTHNLDVITNYNDLQAMIQSADADATPTEDDTTESTTTCTEDGTPRKIHSPFDDGVAESPKRHKRSRTILGKLMHKAHRNTEK